MISDVERQPQRYAVNEMYLSIQGEGVQAGRAMVIVRLQGCGVGCPWCDTQQTWLLDERDRVDSLVDLESGPLGTPSWTWATAAEVAPHVRRLWPSVRWALVTGGEPGNFICAPLVAALQHEGFRVACETSGTAHGVIGAGWDWLCTSPKVGMPGGKVLVDRVLEVSDEIKWPVGRQRDLDNLRELLGRGVVRSDVEVSVQPLWGSAGALQLCVQAVKEEGWRLSLQLHKLIGLA